MTTKKALVGFAVLSAASMKPLYGQQTQDHQIRLWNETGVILRVAAIHPVSGKTLFVEVLEISERLKRHTALQKVSLLLSSSHDGTMYHDAVNLDPAKPVGAASWRDHEGILNIRITPYVFNRYSLKGWGSNRLNEIRKDRATNVANRRDIKACAEIDTNKSIEGFILWSDQRPEGYNFGFTAFVDTSPIGKGVSFTRIKCLYKNSGYFIGGQFLQKFDCIDFRNCKRKPEDDLVQQQIVYSRAAMNLLSNTYRRIEEESGLSLRETTRVIGVDPTKGGWWVTKFTSISGVGLNCPAGFRLHYCCCPCLTGHLGWVLGPDELTR